ncbi:MAG TPA: recombinase family protein [Candidatus Sulfotelmatobacter sp.]
MEKKYFGYIRVSTAKQGEKGVSLQEQKDAISQYAQRYGLTIVAWFEERESAAKRGRPIFTRMMKQLRTRSVRGLIIHKIDRGARNLKDWADLGELIDAGVEVHFANESLDLNTRGGRLSADIQAVVASDYIRNLREETRKGFYGRLKQGFYPLPAPLGYLDCGKAKTKELDSARAPLVEKLFAIYGTGQYSLHRLLDESQVWGLRNRRGRRLTLNGVSTILNNPFYTGMIRIRRTGELFAGNHQPLVAKSLFDRVQSILRGKTVVRTVRHNFAFRKLVQCGGCGYTLIGELQKQHVYYPSQRRSCPTKTVREEAVDGAVAPFVAKLVLDSDEIEYVRGWVEDARANEHTRCQQELQSVTVQLEGLRTRLGRLTDAFLDGTIEKPLFEARKAALLDDEQRTLERIRDLEAGNGVTLQRLERFLELVKNAPIAYVNAIPDEKHDLVRNLFSNLTLKDKNVDVALKPAVELLANRQNILCSSPSKGAHRTWDKLLKKLMVDFEREIIPGEAAA